MGFSGLGVGLVAEVKGTHAQRIKSTHGAWDGSFSISRRSTGHISLCGVVVVVPVVNPQTECIGGVDELGNAGVVGESRRTEAPAVHIGGKNRGGIRPAG